MKLFISTLLIAFSFCAFSQFQTEYMLGLHESIAIYDANTFGIVEATGSKFTTDGGENFAEYDLVSLNNTPLLGFIPTDLEYVTSQTLLCSGYWIDESFEGILRSTNGGQNWEYVYENFGSSVLLHDINIGVDGTIYAVGRNGKILKSIDNGMIWDEQITEGAGQHFQVYTWDEDNFTVGTENGFLTTTDGGSNYNFTSTDAPILGIAYKDQNTAMVCSQSNQVFYTENSGGNWIQSELPAFNIIDLTFIENETWVIATWGDLWITIDNGITWNPKERPVPGTVQHALVTKDGLSLARTTNYIYWSSNISELPSNYVRLNQIILPESICEGENTIALDVGNFGSNVVTELEIDIRINNSFSETIFWSGELASGSFSNLIEIDLNINSSNSPLDYNFDIVGINGFNNTTNVYDDLNIDIEADGFSGDFVIGSTGDFGSLADFNQVYAGEALCGDLTILFENGVHVGQSLSFFSEGFDIIMDAVNGTDADVTILNLISISTGSNNPGNFKLQNMTLEPQEPEGECLLNLRNAHRVEADNLTIHNEGFAPIIEVESVDNLFLTNSSFSTLGDGINFSESDMDSLVLKDVILEAQFEQILGVQLINFEYQVDVHYFEIENSTLHGNQEIIELNTGKFDFFTLKNSFLFSDFGSFYMMSVVSPSTATIEEGFVTIENNVFFNNRGTFVAGSGNLLMRNNTFIAGNEEFGNFTYPIGFGSSEIDYINITNNIFSLDKTRTSLPISYDSPAADITVDYNTYFGYEGNFGPPEEQFQEWQEISGLDQNSLYLDVEFNPVTLGKPASSIANSALQNISPYSAPSSDITGVQRQGELTDIGPYELNIVGLDVGVFDIYSESTCLGSTDFYAEVVNLGSTLVSSYNIQWSIDGVIQETISIELSLEPFETSAVFLGTYFVEVSSPLNISAQLLNINGSIDSDPSNDQISISYLPSVNFSELHVGPGQTYQTLEEAMLILETYGMCGPLEIVLHPGNYEVPFAPSEVFNEDHQFPLTFRSSTGLALDVSISMPSFGWRFENYNNLSFLDLNLVSDGGGSCIRTFNNPESLVVTNCKLNGTVLLQEDEDGNPINLVRVTNCTFINDSDYISPLSNYGNNSILRVEFENNQVSTPLGGNGVNLRNVISTSIKNNVISTGIGQAIKLTDCAESIIEGNEIRISAEQGIFYDLGEQPEYHLCQNNFIHSSTNEGILIRFSGSSSSSDIHTNLIYHNTTRGGLIGLSLTGAKGQVFNNILSGNLAPLSVYLTNFGSEDILLGGNIFNAQPDQVHVSFGQDDFTLAAFENEFEIEANSVVSVVPFTSDEGYETSYALVDGLAGGISVGGYSELDILGNTRDIEFPDVGCFEFEVIILENDIQVNQINIPSDLCGGIIDFYVEFFNTGVNPVNEIEYELTLDEETTQLSWNGTLNPGESLIIDFLSEEIPEDYISLVEVQILTVNSAIDDNLNNNYLSTEIGVPPLSGQFFLGGDVEGRFQDLQEILDFIDEYGICAETEVRILPGEYDWSLVTQGNGGATEGLKIISNTENAEDVILHSETSVIDFEQVNGMTFEEITFIGGEEAVKIWDAYFNIKFRSCVFSSENSFSVLMDGNVGVAPEFDNCTFLSPPNFAHANEASVHHSTFNGGLVVEDCTYCLLFENEILTGTEEDLPNGLLLDGDSEGIVIENNIINGNFSSGIRINDESANGFEMDEKWIVNNIIDIEGTGTGISLENLNYVNVYYNTVKTEQGIAMDGDGSIDEFRIYNNVFYSEDNHAFNPPYVYNAWVFNNIFYSENSTPLSPSTNYETVEDYNQLFFLYNGNMYNNVDINPEFVEGSYAISNPDALGLAVHVNEINLDIYGNIRNSNAPTCGAIEVIYTAPIPGDIDGDGSVGVDDLAILLTQFGLLCPSDDPCEADLDNDGVVTIFDLGILLGGFGN